MNKHEEEEYLKQHPGSDIEEYRKKKMMKREKVDDGGMGALKQQREKLLKSDETVVSDLYSSLDYLIDNSFLSLLLSQYLQNNVSFRHLKR